MAITIADTILDFLHPICIDLIKMNIPASNAYTNITKKNGLLLLQCCRPLIHNKYGRLFFVINKNNILIVTGFYIGRIGIKYLKPYILNIYHYLSEIK